MLISVFIKTILLKKLITCIYMLVKYGSNQLPELIKEVSLLLYCESSIVIFIYLLSVYCNIEW